MLQLQRSCRYIFAKQRILRDFTISGVNCREGVHLRGLPFSCSADEVVRFFPESVKIINGAAGVHFTTNSNGKPSGDAYVELENENAVEKALQMHRVGDIQGRYIEIFKATVNELETHVEKASRSWDNIIRLRGMTFDNTEDDVREFFGNMGILPNGIVMLINQYGRFTGRNTGEALIQFASEKHAEQALKKHKDYIGERFVEVYKGTGADMDEAIKWGLGRSPNNSTPTGNSTTPINENGQYIHVKKMQGLPFRATVNEIYDFFNPIPVLDVHIQIGPRGPTGFANVAFETQQDCKNAQQKDKNEIGGRWIKLL